MNEDQKVKKSGLPYWLKAVLALLLVGGFIGTSFCLFQDASEGSRNAALFAFVALFFIVHFIALHKVKQGTLTVYRDWKDFGASFAWVFLGAAACIFAIIAGICEGSGGRVTCWILSGLSALGALVCFAWMFIGAFTNNRGHIGLAFIALASRILASCLTIAYISKWLDFRKHSEEMTIQKWVITLINLIILGWIYKIFILSLIVDNRENSCVIDD